MAKNFFLGKIIPDSEGLETFDTDASIWTSTDIAQSAVSRYTGDATRSSVMAFEAVPMTLSDTLFLSDTIYLGDGVAFAGEGVYKDFTVVPGTRVYVTWVAKAPSSNLNKHAMYLKVRDTTNGADLYDNFAGFGVWSEKADLLITVPDDCTTIRCTFYSNTYNTGGKYLVDDFGFFQSAFSVDPDGYSRAPHRVGSFHQSLSGRRTFDLKAIHYTFHFAWNFIDATMYDKLRVLFYDNEYLYLDDGDVPQISQTDTIYSNPTMTFSGVTNPSSTQIGYTDSGSALPSAIGDFETTEMSTANYGAIDADDDNYVETTNPAADAYLYHKFNILGSVSLADVQRLRVKVAALSDDSSSFNLDGCILYAWDGSNWVELTRSTSDAKTDLTYATVESTIAQQFVDSSNRTRLLLRSRATRNGSDSLSLRTYYVELEINDGLGLTMNLSHRIVLPTNTPGTDVTVENLTDGSALVYDTDWIWEDWGTKRAIVISNQSNGDQIKITYSRYWEVMFASAPEEWWDGDPTDDRNRIMRIVLQTLSKSE